MLDLAAFAHAPYQWLPQIAAVFAAAGSGLALGRWIGSRRASRPVATLEAGVAQLQSGEAAGPVVERRDEIARLAESRDAMAETARRRELELARLAMTDSPSGLPNRRALEAELAAVAASHEHGVVAAAISIDRFAALSGAIGRDQATAILEYVAARLGEKTPAAMIGRLGDDTLGFIFHAGDAEAGLALASGLASELQGPAPVGGTTVDIALTVGVAPVRGSGSAERSPLACAHLAVDQARAARRRAALYDADRDAAANLSLMGEMSGAIETGAIDVHLQPKYDIRRGRVAGLEALVRWRHPTRGLLGPDRFVRVAEATGHIRALTDHVLARAIAAQVTVGRAGHDLDVAVNISPRLLADPDFAEAALALSARAPGRVWFEVTETAVGEAPGEALAAIERFVEAGIGVAIDNYGAGRSCLADLRKIAAQELKIDKALILDLADVRQNALLVRAAVEFGHGLGMQVTAEGVETNEAFALLAGMGCDFAQGFLIEPPMPIEEILTLLAEDRAAVRYG